MTSECGRYQKLQMTALAQSEWMDG